MPDGINSIRLIPGLAPNPETGPVKKDQASAEAEGRFADLFSRLIDSVNDLQGESAQVQQAFMAGEPVELHQVMIKAREAGIATDLLLQIRNKLLTAYQEIMRMPM